MVMKSKTLESYHEIIKKKRKCGMFDEKRTYLT